MNGNNGNRRAELADDIRRQAGSEATKRFLRTLPAFRLEKEMPRRLSDLLERLDDADAKKPGGERRQ
ncbi:hypothetical protein EN828_00225 [Mesorhizobium sp. M2D.F.Ca.ET.185.01.1.1]|uniref:hypothetical protein n=1 Tax=unclassified Mesorhizobium TaxID=325217 RepID=UPI000FCCB85C|nr:MULTISPECIES: hypothetical protein [unclassified Mesorhizobium]TGP83078.1 hypothetical protein EN870_00525 [bacterium M00.F.Ca.ET.227.01.1.1]TGP99035.1 hypothetical protein EN864_04425 [bacterium M00.F.Ca.ET.221.01.1.1]TGP99765.1 hypothetical protein EN865_04425 [bacterium M00.F.Ca.ET.222.01.1.1]TGU05527.1 hypothetical protein EN806_36595 [bacterium M00.F.Ca.ET.163.01.1.1]TGU25320.1 hypothetical protein EN799_45510 [bacterium M00.F.Ca.ET.156.01.1.1]TGU51094.1 hypothetical protein EN789_001